MHSSPKAPIASSLPAVVLDFSVGGFVLSDDVRDLQALFRDERWPALALLTGRFLRALTGSALARFPSHVEGLDTDAALLALRNLGAIDADEQLWFRTLGALVRDAELGRRRLHRADAVVALTITERLLEWYFVGFSLGPRLGSIGFGAGGVLGAGSDTALCDVLDELRRPLAKAPRSFPPQFASACLRAPAIGSLYVERLLETGPKGALAARTVLAECLRSFPTDARLLQLNAEALFRLGYIAESRRLLEDLNRTSPGDPDTLESLAAYFRAGWEDREREIEARESDLKRALELYQEAWGRSGETRVVAGINAAVLGLLRGRVERAEAIARTVSDSYRHRWAALGERFRFVDFDDRVYLADASLILGDAEFARRRYGEAIATAADPEQARALVKAKLKNLLPAVRLPAYTNQFLDGKLSRQRRRGAQLPLFPV